MSTASSGTASIDRAKIENGEAKIVATTQLNTLYLCKYPAGGLPAKKIAAGKWTGVAVSP